MSKYRIVEEIHDNGNIFFIAQCRPFRLWWWEDISLYYATYEEAHACMEWVRRKSKPLKRIVHTPLHVVTNAK